jgi:phosphoglycolate phosphatase
MPFILASAADRRHCPILSKRYFQPHLPPAPNAAFLPMVTVQCGPIGFADVQAVIFDKDGTLADSRFYLYKLAQQRAQGLALAVVTDRRWSDGHRPAALRPDALQPDQIAQSLLRSWGIIDEAVHPTGQLAVASRAEEEIATAGQLTALGYGWIEALETVRRAFAAVELPGKDVLTPVFMGVEACVQSLHSAGLKVGILSADSTDNVAAFAATAQLTTLLSLCWGDESSDLSKPDPRLFHRACEVMGVDPARTLMVGDSRADIEMASRAGALGAIGAAWGWPLFELPGVDVMLQQIGDIRVGDI